MITSPPAMPREAPPFRYQWSISWARAYRTCPAQWAHMADNDPIPPADQLGNVPQRVGTVLHAALAAAHRAAQARARLYPGAYRHDRSMAQFWAPARTALGQAWTAQRLSAEGAALGHEVVGLLRELLDWLPTPRPGEIVAVEHSYTTTTAAGLVVRWKPDLVLAVPDGEGRSTGRFVIVDWKLGDVADVNVARDDQLLPYAGLLGMECEAIAVRMELRSIRRRAINGADADPDLAAIALRALEHTARTAENDAERRTRPGLHCASCRYRSICPDSAAPVPASLRPTTLVEAGEGR